MKRSCNSNGHHAQTVKSLNMHRKSQALVTPSTNPTSTYLSTSRVNRYSSTIGKTLLTTMSSYLSEIYYYHNRFLILPIVASLGCNKLQYRQCMQGIKSYQDGNSPIGVGQLLVPVWACANQIPLTLETWKAR